MIHKLKCKIVDDDPVSMEKLIVYCQKTGYIQVVKKLMKVLTLIIGFISFGGNVNAQNLTYRAIAMDTNSVLFQNQRVSLRISIMQGSISSTIYSESFITTSDSMGMASFTFGNGTVVSGNLGSVDWSAASNLAKIEIDPNAGNNYYEIGIAPVNSSIHLLLPIQR